ncbi:MAG: FAD:protein FMN transferase [Kineosporiaceae bacterium]|nr:FAD:protein FMN transferase [Kineosporiaceae bacterium]
MTGEPTSTEPVVYRSTRWRALGTFVFLGVAQGRQMDRARALAGSMLDEVDRACSRFRDDSELMRANARAGQWVTTGPLLVEAVACALDVAARTDGLVDPTLGRALVALGYDRDLARIRDRTDGPADPQPVDPAGLPPIPARPGAWREVELDPAGRIRVPAGVALDLGATGKAFACDRIASALADRLGIDCILSLGGDVAVGHGTTTVHPWPVTVAERPDGEVAETLTLEHGAIATSTVVHRTWTHDGRSLHHLLDPATGRPVVPSWRTATVRAASCVEANGASTASLVLGDRAERWLASRGMAARLVSRDGRVRTLGAWPDHPVEGRL